MIKYVHKMYEGIVMNKMQFENRKNIISERVVSARKKLNIRQEDLAARLQVLGVSINQQNISKIEHNQRIVTDYEVLCLCKALSVSEKWLLTGEGES